MPPRPSRCCQGRAPARVPRRPVGGRPRHARRNDFCEFGRSFLGPAMSAGRIVVVSATTRHAPPILSYKEPTMSFLSKISRSRSTRATAKHRTRLHVEALEPRLVLYAQSEEFPVHQWITKQAALFYADQFGQSQLNDYLGIDWTDP